MVLAAIGQAALAFLVIFIITALAGSGADAALSKEFPWQFRLAAACRTPVLMFIVVPLSAVQRLRTRMRRRFSRMMRGIGGEAAARRHAANVEGIRAQLEAWNANGRQRRLRTARPNWQSMSLKLGSNKGECHLVNVGHLDEILEIDADNLTITAEPGVTMGELTDVLAPLNLSLQTHIEMESITLGGLAMGFGIETNSHRYGLFQESVLRFEFLDSRAQQQSVTAESDPELFYALPWSHGTLGFLTCLTIKLTRTKPYVRIAYEPTASAEQLTRRLEELAALPEGQQPDFLEATQCAARGAALGMRHTHNAARRSAWHAAYGPPRDAAWCCARPTPPGPPRPSHPARPTLPTAPTV